MFTLPGCDRWSVAPVESQWIRAFQWPGQTNLILGWRSDTLFWRDFYIHFHVIRRRRRWQSLTWARWVMDSCRTALARHCPTDCVGCPSGRLSHAFSFGLREKTVQKAFRLIR